MRQELSPLILSSFDIEALRISPEEITRAVEAAFRGFSTGDSIAGGKMSMALGEGRHFTAKGGALLSKGYAAVKWYGVVAENARGGMPEFVPLVILSSVDTGLPLAIMDAQWLTAARTAAMTAAAASILAKPDSTSIGFVASGTQAEANLAALLPRFELKRLTAYSRSRANAERLADKAVSLGLSAVVAAQPEDAVAGMDIVITSVPRLSKPIRFLDAGWLSPGTFVSMVDMGLSWDATTATQLGEIFTDAFEPGTRSSREMLNIPGPFAADLAELIADPARWCHQSGSRRAFVFAGAGIADAAAAAVVYERAAARG